MIWSYMSRNFARYMIIAPLIWWWCVICVHSLQSTCYHITAHQYFPEDTLCRGEVIVSSRRCQNGVLDIHVAMILFDAWCVCWVPALLRTWSTKTRTLLHRHSWHEGLNKPGRASVILIHPCTRFLYCNEIFLLDLWPFCRRHCHMFVCIKIGYFDSNFTEICS